MNVVKLRGLPFDANALKIVEFFEDNVVEENIHFVSDRPGGTKPHAGEAYVDCPNGAPQYDALLNYHKKHMGSRYIEVLPSSEEDKRRLAHRLISANGGPGTSGSEDVESSQVGGGDDQGTTVYNVENSDLVLKVRGLPFECGERDVIEKFSDFGITRSRLLIDKHFGGPRAGQNSGSCFLVFDDVHSRQTCMDTMQNAHVGSRYLELFPGTDNDIAIMQRLNDRFGSHGGGHKGGGGYRGGGAGMTMTYQQQQPMPLDHGGPSGAFSGSGVDTLGNTLPNEDDREVVKLRGLPFRATPNDVVRFFEPEFAIESSQCHIVVGRDGRPTGTGLVKMLSEADAKDAVECLDRKHMENRYIEVIQGGGSMGGGGGGKGGRGGPPRRGPPSHGGGAPGPYSKGGGGGRSKGASGGGDYAAFSNPSGHIKSSDWGNKEQNKGGKSFGSWIRLRGLPFEARPMDVAQFFNFRYGINADRDVIIEKMSGRPTGQAFVKMGSSSDVFDAVEKFNKMMMGPRYIEVYESSTEEVGRRVGGSAQ